ncbi:hypothetical protein RB594_007833 [Gaeumannomyces avenae]
MDPRQPGMTSSAGQSQGQGQQRQQWQRPQPQYRRYRYTVNGQTRITPLMPFYGRCRARHIFHYDLPIRPASGSAQPPPPPYDAAGAQSQQQQQQQSAVSDNDEYPYPADRTYLFIVHTELWCYCPDPRAHSYFIGNDPVEVTDEEEMGLFYQASGLAAAQGMYVADDGNLIVQPCPRPPTMPDDRNIWRCDRWAGGNCTHDGWTLYAGASCFGCMADAGFYNSDLGQGEKFFGNGADQPGM